MGLMKKVREADGGDYIGFLAELVEIFSELYRNYSVIGRSGAMTGLSDLFQIPLMEQDPEVFFINPMQFLTVDFESLDLFLRGKLAVVVLFLRRALFQRQLNLGIYLSPDDYDDTVVVDVGDRGKIRSDMAVLKWYLNFATMVDFESYYNCGAEELVSTGFVAMPISTLANKRAIVLSNSNRPPK